MLLSTIDRQGRLHRGQRWLLLGPLGALLWLGSWAGPIAGNEAMLKALVLSRVLLFTQWSGGRATGEDVILLCASPEDELGRALLDLPPSPAGARRLDVRTDLLGQDDGCHVRVMPPNATPVPGRPGLLIVGQGLGMLERGAMLNLQVHQGRVSFDIDQVAARRAGIAFGSQLLRLARFVRKED